MENGSVLLTDFGSARSTDQIKEGDRIEGTKEYLAPEVFFLVPSFLFLALFLLSPPPYLYSLSCLPSPGSFPVSLPLSLSLPPRYCQGSQYPPPTYGPWGV
jgi:serine/threonine protein kinase